MPPSKVFVDTGGWYAVCVPEDTHHSVAARYYADLAIHRTLLLTSDYVLDETLTRIRYDVSLDGALASWTRIELAIKQNRLRVLRVDESVWERAMGVFRKFSDQKLSFTDCTSFVLAQDAGAEEVFGFDSHFALVGLVTRP